MIRHAKWLAHLGDAAYDFALFLNRVVAGIRRKLGMPYWSLSAWAKLKVKNAVSVIGKFEDELAAEAKRHDLQGVICGHIHHATRREIDGVVYLNTGDWVESLTAIAEHYDGEIEIIRWRDAAAPAKASSAKPAWRATAAAEGQDADLIPAATGAERRKAA